MILDFCWSRNFSICRIALLQRKKRQVQIGSYTYLQSFHNFYCKAIMQTVLSNPADRACQVATGAILILSEAFKRLKSLAPTYQSVLVSFGYTNINRLTLHPV